LHRFISPVYACERIKTVSIPISAKYPARRSAFQEGIQLFSRAWLSRSRNFFKAQLSIRDIIAVGSTILLFLKEVAFFSWLLNVAFVRRWWVDHFQGTFWAATYAQIDSFMILFFKGLQI
jgi:hypothetical protein